MEGHVKPQEEINIYNVYRDYIKHEDNLINYRTTWLITIQSFLLATFGFTYQKYYELAFATPQPIGNGLLLKKIAFLCFLAWLAATGISVSVVSYYSIKAASDALDNLRSRWLEILHSNMAATLIDNPREPGKKIHPLLPGLTGGGLEASHTNGATFAGRLPKVFGALWCLVVLAVIFGVIVVTIKFDP